MSRDTCHCGHHKDTHFESKGGCLGVLCNDCDAYRDADKPDTKKVAPKKPNHPPKWRAGQYVECQCYECKRYEAWADAQEATAPSSLPWWRT